MKQTLALILIFFFLVFHFQLCTAFLNLNYNSGGIANEEQSEVQNMSKTFSSSTAQGSTQFSLFEILNQAGSQVKNEAKQSPAAYDPDLIVQKNEILDPILQNWLKISSPHFKNVKKFPLLELPDNQKIRINLSEGYYRINDAYNKQNRNGPPGENFFWFRLTGRHIYYSMTKEDFTVLGGIHIKLIKDVLPLKSNSEEPTCFIIQDKEDYNWKLCTENLKTKKIWICGIKKNLGIVDSSCNNLNLEEPEISVLTKRAKIPIILIPVPSIGCNENWDYQKNGDNWECTCHDGKEQSPIILPLPAQAVRSPVKPIFQYEEIIAKSPKVSTYGGSREDQYMKIILEDGLLKIKHKSFGKIITFNGSVYNAEEIHFHTPSEHKINGKQYDMEMQIIHIGKTSGNISKSVVLSFLFEKKPGVYNKFIDDIDFFSLPTPVSPEKTIEKNIYLPKVLYTADSDDLPILKPFAFYTYQGSLTTPPCSEKTIHYVHAKPIPLGTTALNLFNEASRIPDMQDSNGNVIFNTSALSNNRVIQPLNGRTVYFFDPAEAGGPELPERPMPKPEGHYEKVDRKKTQYFYVNSNQPSGLPGSFVVSESEAKGRVE